jgi:cell wall-associated NlpC family hydrolase
MSTTRRDRGNAGAQIFALALLTVGCWLGPVAAEPHGPDDRARSADVEHRRSRTVSLVQRFIGAPYLWGGESAEGFDCSGLVKYVYALAGIAMPHNVAQQYRYGVPVSRDELKPGDLVFFDELRHNGIYVGDGRFIHAGRSGGNVGVARLEDSWFRIRWFGARRLTAEGRR